MNLNYQELTLLKHIISSTGETELGADGKETLSPRKLNSEESSQRRHFVKATKDITDTVEETVRELSTAHNNLVQEVRDEYKKENPIEDETKEDAQKKEDAVINSDPKLKESVDKVNAEVKELFEEKHEITLTQKTTDFLKKYFSLWGEDPGWSAGDDAAVEEIMEALK